jgi:hypothetical protein
VLEKIRVSTFDTMKHPREDILLNNKVKPNQVKENKVDAKMPSEAAVITILASL